MKKLLLKSGLVLLMTAPVAMSYANNITMPAENTGSEKNYVMRITSLDPSSSVKVYGSVMELAKHMNRVTNFNDQLTPLEINLHSIAVSTQLMSANYIKVEILEKNGNKENSLLSGSGHAVVSFNDSNSVQYVYAR